MSATDELRRLLDERGVKHYDGVECTYWGETVLARYDGSNPIYRFSAQEVVGALSVLLLRVTPEQAIAATLGRGEFEPIDQDWVRDLVERHSYYDIDGGGWDGFHNGAFVAMADEINATLGRGKCRNTQDDFDFMCSECGKCVDNGRVLGFNYCPNCGRMVVDE